MVEAADAGALAYLVKPFREQDVLPAIQTAIAPHEFLYDRPMAEPASPPVADDRATLAELREALARAGFTAERIERELGTHELSSRPSELALHRRRLKSDDAFSTLARLFLVGEAVDAELVDAATSSLGVDGLERLGLVSSDGSAVRADVRLVPHGEYYVASDSGREAGADVPYDHVPGIQAPSVTLAKLAVRRSCARAADVGTGCGIQALLLAKHADRVVATDTNPRALAFAAFNAALNGVDNVELRRGDAFAPLARERFDVVVSNPPYVI